MYRPSHLFPFLNEFGITPKKGLSQNFLIDGNMIQKIMKRANVTSNEVVLEIGSGPGALTQALLATGAQVVAVEKDPILANQLKRFESDRLFIYQDDILQFPFEQALSPFLKGKKAKVIANLPYHLTTPILSRLVPLYSLFDTLTLMVQEEVARRFTAKPGSKEYGSITVFLRFYSDPSYAFPVSKHCFFPIPSVDSAVVHFQMKTPPKVSNPTRFFELVRTCFQQRRKMIRNPLKKLYPQMIASDSFTSRAEDFSLEQFIQLFECLEEEGGLSTTKSKSCSCND